MSMTARWNHREYDRKFPADTVPRGLAGHLTSGWGHVRPVPMQGRKPGQSSLKTNLFAVCIARGVRGHVRFLALLDLVSTLLLLRHGWVGMAGYAQVKLRVAKGKGVWRRTRDYSSEGGSSMSFRQLP